MITRLFCPACKGGTVEQILQVPYTHAGLREYIGKTHPEFDWEWLRNQDYTILGCQSCETLYQKHVWDAHEAERFYNLPSHAAYQGKPLKLSSLAHIAQEIILLRLLLLSKQPRVLDYGMGWANWSTMALAFGCEVHGVEVNDAARRHARTRGIQVIEPQLLADNCYDFINVDQVLEHLVYPEELVRTLAPKLKPGGLAMFGVPGNRSALPSFRRAAKALDPIKSLTEEDLDSLSPLVHLTLFNDRSLKLLAARAGLEFFRPPIAKTLASGTLWNSARQWNRNFYVPFKLWFGTRTRLLFRRPA